VNAFNAPYPPLATRIGLNPFQKNMGMKPVLAAYVMGMERLSKMKPPGTVQYFMD
jgi:hypothetical protein